MDRLKTLLKSYWPHILLATWCCWATMKLNRMEEAQATTSEVESAISRVEHEVREFREEERAARRSEEMARLFRR